jgi:Secretion system C-terminal sorting domain
MKKVISTLSFFLVVYITIGQGCPNQTNIQAQAGCGLYGDGNGNSNWNWELINPNDPQYCTNWYAKTSTSTFLTRMGSPFVNPGSGKLKIIKDAEDYKKTKGWELLQRKFGCYGDAPNPYFVLYNKYSGMIRVFVYITSGSNYGQIMMKIRSVSPVRPATLSQANDLMYTPDKYLSGSGIGSNEDEVLVSITDATGNGSWTVGEFTTTLDHNIAASIYSNAALEVSVYGVLTSTLKAKINGVSASSTNSDDLKDGMFIKKNASSTGNNFDFTANSEKVIKFSKELPKFVAGINSAATSIATNLYSSSFYSNPNYRSFKKSLYEKSFFVAAKTSNTSEFKKEVNKFSKFLGTAGTILGFAGKIYGFFESSSSSPAATPTFTNYNLTLDGSITSQIVVTNFVIRIPANSGPITNNSNETYYNCNLGIFNLKKTPIVETLAYDRRALMPGNISIRTVPKTVRYSAYRIKDDIELVVNKGAGLELVKAEGALVAYTTKEIDAIVATSPITLNPLERHPDRGNYTYFNHMYADVLANRLIVSNYDISGYQQHTIQTPFYDIKCIKNASINITDTSLKLFFRVRATLKKDNEPNGELIYYVNDYVVDKVAGNPIDIPADLSYDLSAFPPYRNYTIPPNVQSTYRDIYSAWQDPAPDDWIVPSYPFINQLNLRYNHSIITSSDYYTTIAPNTNGVVTFRAGAFIELNPKFETQLGAKFLATIDFGYFDLPCSTSVNLTQYTNPNNCYTTITEAQRSSDLIKAKDEKNHLWPNPSTSYFNIELTDINGNLKVELVDNKGIVIPVTFTRGKQYITIYNLQKLKNGFYVVRIISNNKVINKKVEILNK